MKLFRRSGAPPSLDWARANFEGQEAIYVEKGALRVRVTNLRAGEGHGSIRADVIEIPTPGLGVGMYRTWGGWNCRPLGWRIASGSLSRYRKDFWNMGYGGWSLFFDPELIVKVMALADSWAEPDHVAMGSRYSSITKLTTEASKDKSVISRLFG